MCSIVKKEINVSGVGVALIDYSKAVLRNLNSQNLTAGVRIKWRESQLNSAGTR